MARICVVRYLPKYTLVEIIHKLHHLWIVLITQLTSLVYLNWGITWNDLCASDISFDFFLR